MNEEPAIYLSDTEAPAFIFVDKEHQGADGKGWRQAKDESAYEQPVHADGGVLPDVWTGAHVIHRLIEAFKTDGKLPRLKNKGFSSAHPQIEYSDEDREGWSKESADNPVRLNIPVKDMTRMEEAFSWLGVLNKIDEEAAFWLKAYAKRKAYKMSFALLLKTRSVNKNEPLRRAQAAAGIIADGLSACRTPVS